MKPHLPIILLSIFLGSFVSQAAENIILRDPSDLNDYYSNGESEYTFLLRYDIEATPTTIPSWTSSALFQKGLDLFFTSSTNTLKSLSFSNGTSSVLKLSESTSIRFDTLRHLSFTGQNGASAVNLKKGTLYICNVNDSINDTADVVFSNNKGTSYGSAIHNSDSIDISYNGDISIINNSTTGGGALYSAGGKITISNNEDVNISKNSAISSVASDGGAVYTSGNLIISNNEELNINDNSSFGTSTADGGAIYSTGNVTISNNENVNIKGNSSSSTKSASGYAQGGALFSTKTISISNNGNICISGNSSISNRFSSGGAIYSTGTIIISNNGDVKIKGNSIQCPADNRAVGGAIYSTGNLSIVGNDSVTFENNYEKIDNTYLLRSIYMIAESSADELALEAAAKTGGNITFYDTVYMGNDSGASVSFNSAYEDTNGVTQKAGGDIIFSGKYTEDHLKEVKGGVAGTATEIANSRTSSLLNTVNLYGGTLRVEDKAVLKTHALNVTEGSNATIRISDAEVNTGSYNVAVNGTGTLELTGAEGSSKLTAKNLYIEKDGTLCVVDVVDPSEVITLADAETVSIFNEKLGGIVAANVYMEAGATYRADGAHLSVQNGTLIFNATADEKINLVLTLMAAYEADSQVILFTDVNTVDFVLDNITATKSGQAVTLNAADYFTGDWINENTSLVYDKGTIYVTGVNRVIPEPATATLSLLALAGLAARRRRK